MSAYQRTTPKIEAALLASLAKTLDTWLNNADVVDEIMQKCNFGYIGEDVEQRMASAALAVLLAQNDIQVFLHEQGYLDKADEPLAHSEN